MVKAGMQLRFSLAVSYRSRTLCLLHDTDHFLDLSGCLKISIPPIQALPELGEVRQVRIRMVVVLPAPLGPHSQRPPEAGCPVKAFQSPDAAI
jgi:hypothetical protein